MKSPTWGFAPSETTISDPVPSTSEFEPYIVNVDGFSVHRDRNLVSLAFFGIGETMHITDSGLARRGMERARQMRQD